MGATTATQREVSTSMDIPEQLVATHHTTIANIKDGKKISKMEALDDYLSDGESNWLFFFLIKNKI